MFLFRESACARFGFEMELGNASRDPKKQAFIIAGVHQYVHSILVFPEERRFRHEPSFRGPG